MSKFKSSSHPSKVRDLTGRDPEEKKPTLEVKNIVLDGKNVQVKIKSYPTKKEGET